MKKEEVTEAVKKLVGEATPEEIQSWKAKFPDGIFLIESNGHVAYFKNPDRDIVNCAMSKNDWETPLEMYSELGNLTYIGGSREVLDNDQMFLGAAIVLKPKLNGKVATLVNL